jgi:hypothetical protein
MYKGTSVGKMLYTTPIISPRGDVSTPENQAVAFRLSFFWVLKLFASSETRRAQGGNPEPRGFKFGSFSCNVLAPDVDIICKILSLDLTGAMAMPLTGY